MAATDCVQCEERAYNEGSFRQSVVRSLGARGRPPTTSILLQFKNDEAASLCTLIEQTEELYRHYDNQRGAFVGLLLGVNGALSAAPFLIGEVGQLSSRVLNLALAGAGVLILLFSVIGFFGLCALYEEMKRVGTDYKNLMDHLYTEYPAIGKAMSARAKTRLSRNLIWLLIPVVTAVYSGFYLIFLVSWNEIF